MMNRLLLLLFVLISVHSQAQFKNILIDPAAYEPSVAVSKDDAQKIVASASPDNIYFTANGGLSWERTKLTSTSGVSGNLVVIADFKGNFYCLHESLKHQVFIHESKDGGKTWSEGVLISTDTTKHTAMPAVSIDRKGNFFVTWTEFDLYPSDDSNCLSRILLSRSSSGRKWSKPVEISQTKGNCKDDDQTTAGSTPAVMGDGNRAFVSWANQEKIFFDRAFDGGNTWLSNDLAINEQIGGWRMKIPGVKNANGLPSLLVDNTKKTDLTGALYVVWSDQHTENNSDVLFTRSVNFGDNWVQAGRVNDDKTETHQYAPKIALDSETGFIYIVYYDRRAYTDQQTDVYLAYSTNAGSTFKNVKISETPFTADEAVPTGNYIGISAHNGIITPTWTRTDNGKSSVWMSVIKHAELEAVK